MSHPCPSKWWLALCLPKCRGCFLQSQMSNEARWFVFQGHQNVSWTQWLWGISCQDKSRVKDTSVRTTFFNHAFKNRLDNGVNCCINHALWQVRNRCIGTHPTSIRGPCRHHRHVCGPEPLAWCGTYPHWQRQERDSSPVKIPRWSHTRTLVTGLLSQSIREQRQLLAQLSRQRRHTFPKGQAICLDDDWSTFFLDVGLGFLEIWNVFYRLLSERHICPWLPVAISLDHSSSAAALIGPKALRPTALKSSTIPAARAHLDR